MGLRSCEWQAGREEGREREADRAAAWDRPVSISSVLQTCHGGLSAGIGSTMEWHVPTIREDVQNRQQPPVLQTVPVWPVGVWKVPAFP